MIDTPGSTPPKDDAARPRVLYIGAPAEAARVFRTLATDGLEAHSLEGVERLGSSACAELEKTRVVFLDLGCSSGGADDAVRSIRRACPHASIVALAGDLDGEQAAKLLSSGVPSLKKPVRAAALAELAQRLSVRGPGETPNDPLSSRSSAGRLEPILQRYAEDRGLSGQQRTILRLHLAGKNDKEIASDCSCSEATVYEHWRRMARKAGGNHKSCVIVDFHRFLDDG